MAQTHRGESESPARKVAKVGESGQTANELLDDDHNRVLQMFDEYEKIKSDGSVERKRQLAREICDELKVHTQIEEEIYYPRVRSKSGADSLLDEALVEHQSAKELIRDIEMESTSSHMFDAKLKVLGEYVRHHIREERHELFAEADKADCNTPEMARELAERKQEIKRRLH